MSDGPSKLPKCLNLSCHATCWRPGCISTGILGAVNLVLREVSKVRRASGLHILERKNLTRESGCDDKYLSANER